MKLTEISHQLTSEYQHTHYLSLGNILHFTTLPCNSHTHLHILHIPNYTGKQK